MSRGEIPTLPVLDEILPKGNYSEVPLGLVQIPLIRSWEPKVMEEVVHLPVTLCLY